MTTSWRSPMDQARDDLAIKHEPLPSTPARSAVVEMWKRQDEVSEARRREMVAAAVLECLVATLH